MPSIEDDRNLGLFSLAGYSTKATVVSCYDGDTITCAFGLPEAEHLRYRWKCRIDGIDTPEVRTRNLKEKEHGYKARDRLRGLILHKEVDLVCGDFDKYGRVLVGVFIDGRNVTDILIEEELAFAYDGGTKKVWFPEAAPEKK